MSVGGGLVMILVSVTLLEVVQAETVGYGELEVQPDPTNTVIVNFLSIKLLNNFPAASLLRKPGEERLSSCPGVQGPFWSKTSSRMRNASTSLIKYVLVWSIYAADELSCFFGSYGSGSTQPAAGSGALAAACIAESAASSSANYVLLVRQVPLFEANVSVLL